MCWFFSIIIQVLFNKVFMLDRKMIKIFLPLIFSDSYSNK